MDSKSHIRRVLRDLLDSVDADGNLNIAELYGRIGRTAYEVAMESRTVDDAGCDSSGKYVGGPALPEGGNG